jgi:antitoxin (DNA-binding transcriptional repressor) of toxin-antitoxin stability system
VSFVTALALGIAIFVAAPLLAHRLRRLRADERPFAPARLVPAAPPRARRRARLEDRGLFAVRVLAIVALALLGASPLVRCSRLSLSRSSGASMAVAIVVDDSMSMRAHLGTSSTTRFDRAKNAASELLAGARDGDSIGIVLAGAPVRVALAPTTDIGAVGQVVDGLHESDRATDLEGAIHVAESLLASLPQVDKRIVVLSDLADGQADAAPLGENAQFPVWTPLADIAKAEPDCGIVSADDVGGHVRVRLACGKGVTAAGRRVEVRAGNRVLGSAVAGAVTDVDVPLSNDTTTGERTAHLLGGDAIASDDAAPILVAQGGAVGVVAEPSDETAVTGGPPIVEQALAALRIDLATRPLPAVPDQSSDFSGILGLVVDDPPGFTPEQRHALAGFLDGGGVLLLALGPRAAAAPLGATLEPVLDHATTWVDSKARGVAKDAPTELLGESTRSLVDVGASRRTLLAPGDVSTLTDLLPWSDGAPLVARRAVGSGEAVVTTLPFSLAASDFALRPAFIALLDDFVARTHAHAAPRRADVGAAWTLPESASHAKAPDFTGTGTRPVDLIHERGGLKLSPALVGAYHVTVDGKDELRVAAPVAKETDLRPRRTKAQGAASHLGATQARVDVSGQIAVALLALLLAEIVLRVRAQRTAPSR